MQIGGFFKGTFPLESLTYIQAVLVNVVKHGSGKILKMIFR